VTHGILESEAPHRQPHSVQQNPSPAQTQHRHFNLAMMIDNSSLEPFKHDKMSYVSFSRSESIEIAMNRRIALAGYDWLQTF
jgi:hypothetical protein